MSAAREKKRVNAALLAVLGLNFLFWLGSSDIYAKWDGVPPVPTVDGALMMTLGDSQFSYRFGAITLQNLGDTGGQTTPLKDYNYEKLGKWFWLLNELDRASNHVPMLAAYYFGAVRTPKDVAVLVDYLAAVGVNPVGNKWRWLVQAIFMARHRLHDLHLALDLSYKLAKMQPIGDTLPEWARQMPAFVLTEQGDKQAARKIVEDLLVSGRRFHPNEVNFMKAYLVEQLGVDPQEIDQIIKMRGNEDEGPLPASPLPPPAPE
ncbi:MAG: hypothetical protein ACAH83_13285 [Alphaproteobacteria bacterium]